MSRGWLGLLFILSCICLLAQIPYEINDAKDEQNIMPNEQFIFIDTTGDLTLKIFLIRIKMLFESKAVIIIQISKKMFLLDKTTGSAYISDQ